MKKPTVFGKYLLLERINVGGMAEVFIAKAFGVGIDEDPRALAFAQAVQAEPDGRAGLGDLARAAGASLRTLQRLFPRQTGLTLEAWRQKARMIHAAAALSAGASVTAASLDCGYESASAFITAFRRQFGRTPGRYRAA